MLVLPYSTPPLTMNMVLGAAWTKHRKAVRDVQDSAGWLALQKRIPRLARARVELIYWPGSNRVNDADGLAATLKPLLDGLRQARVIPDDRGRHVVHVGLRVVERADDPENNPRSRLWLVVHEV